MALFPSGSGNDEPFIKVVQSYQDITGSLAAHSVSSTMYLSINNGYPSGYTYIGHRRQYDTNGLIVIADSPRTSTQATNPNTIPIQFTNITNNSVAYGRVIIETVFVKDKYFE